ncbi:PoNi-like cognate immunity protein [Pseudomonas fontis]|uniref:PoNi-like cognate immunity protein n=1 Tax=Pseudomonas fontis TaxID=2942633 RepID=A0ABT5P1E5_9PSED|nr:PoNi-like cognate immunity protein [Pseudomonas fontis]MDD0977003.1 PoNi-like cognate immunity protein [Pseudomonas fontis]MDD0994240.1 PoNi-like cognate immunity protein [Pseudomonas fontis]
MQNKRREPLLDENAYLDSIMFKKEFYFDRELQSALDKEPSNEIHRQRRSWQWASQALELLIQLYSGGEPISDLKNYAEHMFSQFERHKSDFPNFTLELREPDAYQYILWLISLATLFDIPERMPNIARWVNHLPEENHDPLLFQLFARAGVSYPCGRLIHTKPYAELQAALNATGDTQQQLISRYLKHWYSNMKNCYWHGRDRRQSAGFFGYWAFEAGMVTVLWNVDDSNYRDLPYYPKDLVDYARAKHVAGHFPKDRLIDAP